MLFITSQLQMIGRISTGGYYGFTTFGNLMNTVDKRL
jgi:hypothetical protein